MPKKSNFGEDPFENDPFNNDFYGKQSTGYPPPPAGFIENSNQANSFSQQYVIQN